MVRVKVRCPSCQKAGNIEVEENIVQQSLKGITAVNIAEFFVCKHSFIVYVDKNFTVRDCYISDFKIELPEIMITRVKGEDDVKEDIFEKIDTYIVTLNLNVISMSYILYCFFRKKKILFLNELDVLNHHLKEFINYILEGSFDFDFTIMSKDLYKKNKKQFKDHIVLDNDKVINDNEKILSPKRVKVEQMIIRKFLEEHDAKSGLIILKNEVYKSFHISKTMIDSGKRSNQKISQKLIVDTVRNEFNVKISKDYLNFLSSIISDYFGLEVVGVTDVDSFISFL